VRKLLSPVGAAFALAAVLMCSYYHWQVRAAGFDSVWGHDLPGYYNYLAQGITAGHLYLPIQPSPQLLAQPNPWDPSVDDALKLHDTALYNGHYYLYHGVGPAIMAFVPWRLLTRHDLPENAAIFAFCFLGFLFSAGALLGLFDLAKLKPGPVTVFMALLALGACQCVPLLLNRVWVYEVAIGAGYFCISVGMFCLVRHWISGSARWLIPAGLFFGIAIACRPHLGLVGALAFLLLVPRNWRTATARFGLPFVLVCFAVCIYNFERFGNPMEFGTKYLLGSANQTEVHWRNGNVRAGLYYMLYVRPDYDPVFPWLHATLRKPDFPRPPIYTLEPIVGALFLAPFLVLLVPGIRAGPARGLLALMVLSGSGILLFITGTGWSVQRYQVDFLQLLVPAALLCAVARLPGPLVGALIVPGLITGLIFGFNGPYNETLHNRPARYAKIAGWFSPIEKYRPQLHPAINFEFDRPGIMPEGTRDVLLGAGPVPARYEVRLEQMLGKPRLVSEFFQVGVSTVIQDLVAPPGRMKLRVWYDRPNNTMLVSQDGAVVLTHQFPPLVAAPTEINPGPPVR
jgi:hypothetical protein